MEYTEAQLTTMSTTLATTVPRKTAARLARPAARYWKGKAPKGADALPSDSEDEDEEQAEELEEGDEAIEDIEEEGLDVRQEAPRAAGRGLNVTLRDVNISKEGKVIVAGKEQVESGELQPTFILSLGLTIAEEESEEEEEEEEEGKPDEEEVRVSHPSLAGRP